MNVDGLPLPPNAPEPRTCWRIERPRTGLVRLVLDPPHRPKLPLLDVPTLRDLDLALADLADERELVGLVITGRDPLTFAGGADVEGIGSITNDELARRVVAEGQELFQRLHELSKGGGGRVFVVAAVGGPVPGGACELSLACDRIVLANDPKTRIGLPEVKLGIVPGWGGTQRLPRRTGVPAALDLILTGKLVEPQKALSLGIVDRLAQPADLVRIADEIAMGDRPCRRARRSAWKRWFIDRNPVAGAVVAHQAYKSVWKRTRGHYPAPLAALSLVVRAPRMRLGTGLHAERDAVVPLVTSPVTKSLVGLFFAAEAAKKLGEFDGRKAPAIERAAVVGAGTMGGGIARRLALSGVSVRLFDLQPAALDAVKREHARDLKQRVRRRRLQQHEADAAYDRLAITREVVGIARTEFVIEAVAERLDIKRQVLGDWAARMPPGAILATNTSSLSIDAIAEGLAEPERVVGMHFFNPVDRMPLVEVVRGTATSDETIARTARLALDLGKTPVVTRDVAGFLVNRVLGPYLDEAVRLLESGVGPERIDDALLDFGMPMGPCALLDEIGLDIAQHAGASLAAAYGPRMQTSTFLARLLEHEFLGKKSGGGIYLYESDARGRRRKRGVNPRVGAGGRELSHEDIVDRTVLAMANEAVRALEEGVVEDAATLDLATVFGMGFAPFRGGVLRFLDALGPQRAVDRLRAIHGSPDVEQATHRDRFAPAHLLLEHARNGAQFR
ncbi:MAG: 3-hydroxyacyl-CoA dehydrogenase NAD-binding domain-containing protein [Planctomycetota bacterium]